MNYHHHQELNVLQSDSYRQSALNSLDGVDIKARILSRNSLQEYSRSSLPSSLQSASNVTSQNNHQIDSSCSNRSNNIESNTGLIQNKHSFTTSQKHHQYSTGIALDKETTITTTTTPHASATGTHATMTSAVVGPLGDINFDDPIANHYLAVPSTKRHHRLNNNYDTSHQQQLQQPQTLLLSTTHRSASAANLHDAATAAATTTTTGTHPRNISSIEHFRVYKPNQLNSHEFVIQSLPYFDATPAPSALSMRTVNTTSTPLQAPIILTPASPASDSNKQCDLELSNQMRKPTKLTYASTGGRISQNQNHLTGNSTCSNNNNNIGLNKSQSKTGISLLEQQKNTNCNTTKHEQESIQLEQEVCSLKALITKIRKESHDRFRSREKELELKWKVEVDELHGQIAQMKANHAAELASRDHEIATMALLLTHSTPNSQNRGNNSSPCNSSPNCTSNSNNSSRQKQQFEAESVSQQQQQLERQRVTIENLMKQIKQLEGELNDSRMNFLEIKRQRDQLEESNVQVRELHNKSQSLVQRLLEIQKDNELQFQENQREVAQGRTLLVQKDEIILAAELQANIANQLLVEKESILRSIIQQQNSIEFDANNIQQKRQQQNQISLDSNQIIPQLQNQQQVIQQQLQQEPTQERNRTVQFMENNSSSAYMRPTTRMETLNRSPQSISYLTTYGQRSPIEETPVPDQQDRVLKNLLAKINNFIDNKADGPIIEKVKGFDDEPAMMSAPVAIANQLTNRSSLSRLLPASGSTHALQRRFDRGDVGSSNESLSQMQLMCRENRSASVQNLLSVRSSMGQQSQQQQQLVPTSSRQQNCENNIQFQSMQQQQLIRLNSSSQREQQQQVQQPVQNSYFQHSSSNSQLLRPLSQNSRNYTSEGTQNAISKNLLSFKGNNSNQNLNNQEKRITMQSQLPYSSHQQLPSGVSVCSIGRNGEVRIEEKENLYPVQRNQSRNNKNNSNNGFKGESKLLDGSININNSSNVVVNGNNIDNLDNFGNNDRFLQSISELQYKIRLNRN